MNFDDEMVISAALDGEGVDLGILRSALGCEEGRKVLASFVLLRAEVAADEICTSCLPNTADLDARRNRIAAFLHRSSPARGPAETSWRRRFFNYRHTRIGMAAALAFVAMAGAFWFGTVWRSPIHDGSVGRSVQSALPAAYTGSSDFRSGDRTSSSKAPSGQAQPFDGSTGAPQRILPAEPPEATRVLRYLPGTDWRPGLF